MADNHDHDKRAHGETGDTVQQAAEVSRPTSSAGRVLDTPAVPQAPTNPELATETPGSTSGGAGRS